jgi:predicted RNA-binding protein with PUA-like domain
MPKKRSVKKAAPKKTATRTTKVAAKRKGPLPPLVSTGFWLLKSEPESYSIEQFAKDKKTLWTGVRNYLARNYMMTSMVPGDHFLFYHSNAEVTGVVGTGRVSKISQPDPSALDESSDYHDPKASFDHPIWFCAEVSFETKLSRAVTLAEIRDTPALAKMALLQKGQRLSIQSVSKTDYDLIVKMGSRK